MDNSTTDTSATFFARMLLKVKKLLLRYLLIIVVILFVIPFAGSVYLFANRVNSDIRFIETERVGFTVYQALFKLMVNVQKIQRLLFESEASGAINPHIVELKNKIHMHIDDVDSCSAKMNELGVLNSWNETKSKLFDALDKPQFARQNEANTSLWKLMRDTVTQSNLILDPNRKTYFAINIMTVIIPNLEEELNLLLANINVMVLQSSKTDLKEYNLFELTGKLDDWVKLYSYSLTFVVEKDFALKQKELHTLNDITDLNKQLKNLIDRNAPSEQFQRLVGTITVSIETFEDIYNELAQQLNGDLQQRVYNYKLYRLKMLLALAATLLVMLAIFIYARKIRIDQEEVDKASCTNAILSTVADGIITINPWRIIENFNQSAERIFGYKAHEVIGKNINVLMPEPYHYKDENYWQPLNIEKTHHVITPSTEVMGRRKDTSLFAIDLAVGVFGMQCLQDRCFLI